MDKLPSKSLSKSILIAVPLFCLVLALLDAADELSYLFILQFLGNMAGQADMVFLPTTQPETGKNYQKYDYFKYQGIQLMETQIRAGSLPLVKREPIEQWAQKYEIVRGCTPRWLVPIVADKVDSLLIVANVSHELAIGLGLKSNLQTLKQDEVALSSELLSKLSKQVGDKISVTLSVQDLFKGRKMIEKYQSVESENEGQTAATEELEREQLLAMLQGLIGSYNSSDNFTIDQRDLKDIVEYVYNMSFTATFTIRYEYKNNGLYSSTLNNVVLTEFAGFSRFLQAFIKENILNSKLLKDKLYKQLKNSRLSTAQILAIKSFINLNKQSPATDQEMRSLLMSSLQDYPLTMHVTFNNRELVYHPSRGHTGKMYQAMQNSPGQFQVASVYPFFQDLDGIRFFFKSVIQIFTFVCLVIFFNTMRLILKQVYEEKEVEVGIWRTLGAGGVKEDRRGVCSQGQALEVKRLKSSLGVREKVNYLYKMLVKVGFFYYWLVSCLISATLYQLLKQVIYKTVSELFRLQQPPPQYLLNPIILFLSLLTFIMVLVGLHIRDIYINPLVSTIKPLKRTFDVVKIRVIKIATFGITLEVLVIGILLVYYGVVSYYWIPLSILQNDGYMQTILFNSIFIFMILGSIIVLVVMQSRFECWILHLLFYCSKYLSTLKLIMLKSIKAKQYKNIKVSLIISLIFAFLLFFAAGIQVELKIIESFTERQLGGQLVIQNFQNYLDRPKIQQYLNTIKDVKYAWLSQNLGNKTLRIGFETFMQKGVYSYRISFKAISANFLDIALNEYYYPEYYYEPQIETLQLLPNGLRNGFNTLYKYDKLSNNISIGKYDPLNSMVEYDPNKLNIAQSQTSIKYLFAPRVPPNQQIINVVMTNTLRKRLGVLPGDTIKLFLNHTQNLNHYFLRCRVMHTLKMMPGIDIYSRMVFMSESQAKYLFEIAGYNNTQLSYYKLFVSGVDNLQEIGNRIVAMSPQHTLLFNINQSKLNFQLLEKYLKGFVLFVTAILAVLSVLFLAVYTHGKCKEEAQNFKMLRAIGLSVFDIRLMIFLEILIRIVVSIVMGIILGILFSLGLSGQIQEVLMLKAPMPNLDIVIQIAVALLAVFSLTVVRSTHYLTMRTVLETSKT